MASFCDFRRTEKICVINNFLLVSNFSIFKGLHIVFFDMTHLCVFEKEGAYNFSVGR